MKRFISLLFLFVFLSGIFPLFGQQFYFKKYQVENGLSHNTVWCIMQDSYGFMWFGTSDGLNRFDGYEFKVYRNNDKDATSLGNNQVYTLCEDSHKNIWIGTSKGVYIYNYDTGKFNHFDHKTDFEVLISCDIKKILLSTSGKIWIATLGQGFFIYDPEKQILTQNSQYTPFVWDISEDSIGHIYMSSHEEGLFCFDQNGRFIEKETSSLNFENKGNVKINCVEYIDNNVWFSVGATHFGCLNPKNWKCTYYENKEVGTIRDISKYSEWKLLIGTDNGLYWFDILTKTFDRIESPSDFRGLSDQSIYTILRDKEGGYWISTHLGGVNYLAKQAKSFEYYHPSYSLSGKVIGKVIYSFAEDLDRNIWIGGSDGLRMLDNNTQKIKDYPVAQWNIQSLLIDDDNLWVGTLDEGVKIINTKTNKIIEHLHYRYQPNTVCSNDILSLYKDRRNDIYVGTSWGMCRYNRETKDFTTLNFVGTMISVADMIEDKNSNIWVATLNSGVFRYSLNNRQSAYFTYDKTKKNSLGNNSVITLFEDSNGLLWFGTDGGGLYFYDDEEGFINFDLEDNILPSKTIYSIEEDNSGFLWISTNAGLLKINSKNKFDSKIFTQENGLQSNQFNSRASLKASNGRFYFGGINGFNVFFPDEFKENLYIPPVYITDIHFYNKKNGKTSIIKTDKPAYLSKKITIPFNQNNIVFKFVALSYEDSPRNQYCYKLEGFDADWIYSNSNMTTYANLSPGKYMFHVTASNNDGKWNENATSLEIIIIPPWWKSTIAYICYFILICVLLFILVRYGQKKTNEKIRRQIEKYSINKEKEVYQSKIDFFVNLVHEIRTPLSLIKLPLEKVTETNKDEKSNRYLSTVNKNIDYLLNIVNQLLDFQKTESKKVELYFTDYDINLLVTNVYNQFDSILELKSISFNLELPKEKRVYSIDVDVITKILINLISNAVKYSNSLINIRLEYFDDSFVIIIKDDGIGVADSEKNKIFEAFYQTKDTNNKGIGIGLAFSKQLAEVHNGILSVVDNEFGGATFKLEIKKAQSIESQEIVENTIIDFENQEQYQSSGFQSCRVLVVEDNTELLNLITDMLSDSFIVIKAKNGKDALYKLLHKPVDIVVTDVMMPEMDGFELSRRIKSDINISHIPVILLTAKVTTEAKIEGMQQGADVYIEKPFSIKYLKMQIENLLKLRLSFQEMMIKMPFYTKPTIAISNKDHEFLTKLKDEIEEHLSESDFSIDSIAEAMFMSRSNFYRKIKSITDMAPNDYLKTVRLNRAAELLLQKDCRVGDIYLQVGFSSSSYFAKCFKALFNASPREYKDCNGQVGGGTLAKDTTDLTENLSNKI
ncbi:Sensor histidine kinase TodS [termite gut metagenome]|uniref:Sensor histidine kinase TodS n=1 Tax=termite gut metagenome TaxID=433724 RepID=A0A5J4SWZ4_9ZZZZ